jgi:hypothetical protein
LTSSLSFSFLRTMVLGHNRFFKFLRVTG